MFQIIQELEQFGLKICDNVTALKPDANYLMLKFSKIQKYENFERVFIDKVADLLGEKSLKKTTLHVKKGTGKKIEKKVDKYCDKVCNYIKFLGKYVGMPRTYSHSILDYRGNLEEVVYEDDEPEDDEPEYNDSDEDEDEIKKNKSTNDKSYEYINKNIGLFNKNNNMTIYDFNKYENIKLFEVDNSFDETKFLGIILMVCSNIDYERDKMLKVICSCNEITLFLLYNEFPKSYNKKLLFSIDNMNDKRYTIDNNFIFFK